MRRLVCITVLVMAARMASPNSMLIPMDAAQKNHLKAYGLAYLALQYHVQLDWLLNYRGGSFLIDYSPVIENECQVRGVSYEILPASRVNAMLHEIENPSVNMNIIRLETAPRIAVYSPRNEFVPDDEDAVMNVLDYAEIPYDIIYDEEVLHDALAQYDWLHTHHEDFTGQYGRFLRRESAVLQRKLQEILAPRLGYGKVSEMKLDVALKIKAFCASGGYLFAMCSGAETLDIALAADGVDICERIFDGDDMDPGAQQKLDYSKTLAFEGFSLEPSYSRQFSDINTGWSGYYEGDDDYFTLFNFSAKWDIIPSILTQDHQHAIKEFIGQTTAFNGREVKPQVTVMGENAAKGHVRYIYGELGNGHWTYYSGHDPEGMPGRDRRPADLNQYPNSPGYRLILNNVLFPSAQKKKQKT